MAIVYLGLGTNLGDREGNLREAIHSLSKKGFNLIKASRFIETDPDGGPPQGQFLNAVIKGSIDCTADQLLTLVKQIEKSLGRVPTVRNGPRLIDIDILFFDNLQINSLHLTIPHPRVFMRDFVLDPLKEIDPKFFKGLDYADHS